MKVVADSGSTKTDWRIILPEGTFLQAETGGLNPNFASEDDFQMALEQLTLVVNLSTVTECWFYGAGCKGEGNKEIVLSKLQTYFPTALIHVESDMLGAARALCGSSPGMAAILGTGMNTCVYDGEFIVANHTSLGYLLGDEGSGAYFGKMLLTDALKGKLPPEIKVNFDLRFNLSHADIIENIYRKPLPNRFLAQFAKFIYQNLKHQYCKDLVINGFRSFFKEQIKTYPDFQKYPLHLTGSVAYYFGNLLKRVAEEEGVIIGSVVEKPIAALALYHAGL